MGFLDFITKIFGNKSQRDLKEITPVVDKIKEQYEQVKRYLTINFVSVRHKFAKASKMR